MRIAVVGAGALGLYYGALLQRSGQEVFFLLRRDFEAISRSGLRVFSINGDFELKTVHACRTPVEIGEVDLVLVGLKTFANNMYAELIAPLMGAGTRILTLQNGLGNEEALAGLFGAESVIGGVAFLCSNRGEPGTVHHLGAGRIVIGEHIKLDSRRVEELAEIFISAGVDCRVTPDLRRSRWEKLVWNIPFNGLSALLMQSVDQLLAVSATRKLVHEIMLEVIRAGNAQQLSKPVADGYADAMMEFTDAMGVYKPSMQIDREEGRQLEISAILKTPLAFGTACGVAMPRVETVVALLEQSLQRG